MKPNTISLKQVIGEIKEHPLLASMSDESIITQAVKFLRILGLKESFEEKICTVSLDNYRGVLPDDFYEVIQVRTNGPDGNHIYFRSITDNFYLSNSKTDKVSYTYKIQGNIIFCSPMKQGTVEIAYRAIQLDNCGLPAIPDNEKFIRALEAYIKVRRFTTLFEIGQLDGKILQNAQQEYAWAVGAAHTDMKMPSIDELESISNIINSHTNRSFTHYRGYSDSGSREIYRTH